MSDLQKYIDERNAKTRAWVAEDPENRWAGYIPDADSLAVEGIHTVEDFEKNELQNNIWDLYKSVHGIRPRFMNLTEMSLEELEAEFDSLCRESEQQAEREAEWEAQAIKEFEDAVANMIACGAGDRETAIRWLRDAEQDEYCLHGDDHFEYANGLPDGYLAKKEAA